MVRERYADTPAHAATLHLECVMKSKCVGRGIIPLDLEMELFPVQIIEDVSLHLKPELCKNWNACRAVCNALMRGQRLLNANQVAQVPFYIS